MNILFIGLNYAPEMVGIAPYSTGTCEALAAGGHQVEAIVAKPYYPQWRIDARYSGTRFYRRSIEGGVHVTRCSLYVPRKPGGLKRIVHHLSFAAAALPAALAAWRRLKPEVVLTVAPSLLSAPVAWVVARLAGAQLWLHVQDFEAEAMVATGLVRDGSLAARAAQYVEQRMLRSADVVTSISPQMCRKACHKGARRVLEFRNWAEIDSIKPWQGRSGYRDAFGLGDRIVAFYSGNIANKQGIEIIIAAARLLRHRQDLVFVICGDGPNRERLEALCEGLENVRLQPLQPAERMGELLGAADICLLPQIPEAADLVLPSKLANMLAAGKPVVATALPGTGLYAEVEGVGRATVPGDEKGFAAAIDELCDDPPERLRLGAAARLRAEERWSRTMLLAGFVEAMATQRDGPPASANL